MQTLEEKISEWRKQMLAAGIKSPAPLEELEIHLREEIERQIKSGQSEGEAFAIGVQKIGRRQVLQREFAIVEGELQLRRAISLMARPFGLITGWLTAGFALLSGALCLGFHWDLFIFHPRYDWETVFDILTILVAGAGIWFLARASRDRASRVASLFVCLCLAVLAVAYCHQSGLGMRSPELNWLAVVYVNYHPLTHPRGGFPVFGITAGWPRGSDPLWFRGGVTLLLCMPAVLWARWERRHTAQRPDSSAGSRPVCSG